MHIAVISLGSRGDVQPYVALGRGFYQAGHAVRVLSHENYKALIESQGLEFWPVQGDAQAMAEAEIGALIRAKDGVGRAAAIISAVNTSAA